MTPPKTSAETPYKQLEDVFRRHGAIMQAAAVLEWDTATLMPPGGAPARAEQSATLERIAHELLTDGRTADLLAAAEDNADDLDPWRRANLRAMRRDYGHAAALPSDLVEALSRAAHGCEMVWREARPNGDWAALLPSLRDVLRLTVAAATARGEAKGAAPYDALLDLHDDGSCMARIDPVFDDYAAFLPNFLPRVLERQRRAPPPRPPRGPFARAAQEKLFHRMMEAVGFDFDHGRLDVSRHPFCGGAPDDVRITTRYDEDDFTSGLMGVLHETGHAMYERGLPADWRLQPVGAAASTTIHESQSLLIEMQACRSPWFLRYAAPLAAEAFGPDEAHSADNLLRLATWVKPDFIRVDADEVTYPAHVILRYRLEKALIAGDLELAEVPGAWNAGLNDLLGVTPPDDRRGCLQDIHWPLGAFGYFPTYTLGAMAAAQIFSAARSAVPGIPEAIARGDFSPLMGWLRENVHGLGASVTTDELLVRATGRALDPQIYIAHLKARYLDR